MFTVLGATGHTGSLVVTQLLDAGKQVRAVGRDGGKLEALLQRGAEAAVGNVEDARFIASVLDGAEGVYALIPPDYSNGDYLGHYQAMGRSIATAAREATVKRMVFLSSLGAELESDTGPIMGLRLAERELQEVPGLDLLILRAGYFYENFFNTLGLIRHQGINGGAISPDVPFAMTAARDIATSATRALLAGDFSGVQLREVLGPRDYTMTEATRMLGEAIGSPGLPYVRFPDEGFAGSLIANGFAPPVAQSFVDMARGISEGRIRPTQGRSAATTGGTPFEGFAQEFAAAYRSA
ncbi:MAG: NAD(P)H-binding protein [Cytophagaceae bacterium]|nr:NAD(P)H-binding protein [Gemmatimonadaceae bacterium]